MQMHGNQVTRDASMAANVKWILDQNPKAKIVLWAHNGHVGTSDWSMGGHLRKMFGDQMVIFGFSFNQGGFQAIRQNGSVGLKDFKVPPAPAGYRASTSAPMVLNSHTRASQTFPSCGFSTMFSRC